MPVFKCLADQRDRMSVSGADLEDHIVRLDVENIDRPDVAFRDGPSHDLSTAAAEHIKPDGNHQDRAFDNVLHKIPNV